MANAPAITPMTDIRGYEIAMLCGIRSRKEIASITPAAKHIILQTYPNVGIFRMPINEPTTGPKTAKITIQTNGSMVLPLRELVIARSFFCRVAMSEWFQISDVEEGIFAVEAPGHIQSYLINRPYMKEKVKAPVVAVGRLRRRSVMEEAFRSGQADFISMCRPFIMNGFKSWLPSLPKCGKALLIFKTTL